MSVFIISNQMQFGAGRVLSQWAALTLTAILLFELIPMAAFLTVKCYHAPAMIDRPLQSRRKLATTVRKRITSYYTEDEQKEIAKAATVQRISISAFVAGASLKEARKIISQTRPQPANTRKVRS